MSGNLPVGATIAPDLNAMQREAVLYLDGPCLVLAGAGSGKTRVITQKIAYLLRECGYHGRHVVALTFTNKAAREMGERVKTLVDPKRARGLTISTFHSLGLRFLREEASRAGLKPGFSIIDSTDALAIIQELLATTDKARLRAIQQSISLWKNALLDPDAAAHAACDANEAEAVKVYRSYQATLQAYQSVDFDDLIRLPTLLLQADDEVRARWQARVQYLLIDEYQDTNSCQYGLLRHLCGDRAMFTAVGDDDQAIYAWRGATVENLSRLNQDYPGLKLIKLEQNYRSVQRILHAANQVIGHNPKTFEKTLWSDLGVGEPIDVTAMDSDLAEAESIALRLSAARFERQAQWKDFAVLYRSNHQARVLEQALRNLHIPYTLSGGQSFFDKAEVRDILAYLRLLANDNDDPALIRAITTPRRGIGQATLQALGTYAASRQISLFEATMQITEDHSVGARQCEALRRFGEFIQRFQARAGIRDEGHPEPELQGVDGVTPDSPARVLDELLGAIDYERYLYDTLDDRQAGTRWTNVLEMVGWLKRKAQEDHLTVLELVQHVALVTMLERSDDEDPDTVKLSTLHASKGLEYPHVYLVGVEEGLLPHQGADEDDDSSEAAVEARLRRIQEERRLMYVGITRARRSLHISWCRKRRRGREDMVRERSRFVEEMGLGGTDEPQAGPIVNPEQTLGRLRALLKGGKPPG
ncbi:MAG: UvrD-helicase domain-containing protein [Alcaligenaceae bacterium]|nr:UvrD-helicase domain-containing protein [Alcaligenaceae bacterium]